ncbi:head maturation protease, ClpP-related [Chitinasiproducens palmae]|uniref:ATP-dependent Clp protease proteolytic subunit n=1 Tax=Chitinasiproducens palmae TaxID=1770053 RepID=A0A1H2PT46_9BURK|nr:head maturation protease, ClpP-related [Chitinasiproducens palmae]SDV49813.1 ATP-dependent protease ClpP, protease subunit [Chitinasiproducens palmae]
MTIRNLPAAPAAQARPGVSCELSPRALERWKPAIHAAADGDASTISIFDPIGYDSWSGDGVTAKRIGAALRSIGEGDVTVRVNSPGGDMFEGLAIYNLLREHKGRVTVQVLGLAASAASIIAMAADELQMARAGFPMIHNAWVLAAGNRNDLREIADTLATFDSAMAGIYAARTGDGLEAMQALMDRETWIGGSAAIEQGFADSLLAADQIAEADGDRSSAKNAARQIEVLLARQGLPRSERRRLIQEIKASTPGAADPGTPGAADAAFLAEISAELSLALMPAAAPAATSLQ